jgi:hypothetical protein
MLFACGGNATFSPTATGTTPSAGIGITINPSPASTYPGGQIHFTAIVTGTNNPGVNWSVTAVNGGNAGAITSAGVYTAPAEHDGLRLKRTATAKGTKDVNYYTVQATSQADPTKAKSVTVTVADLSISILPNQPKVIEGQTVDFTASVGGIPNAPQGVQWFGSDGGGTINEQTGVFTAGFTPGVYQIYAQSTSETGIQSYMDLTVVPPSGISVKVNPSAGKTNWIQSQPVPFTAKVNGSTDQSVTWSVVPAANGEVFGTITSSGVYTASQEENYVPTVTIQATSVADPTKYGTATVTISNNS